MRPKIIYHTMASVDGCLHPSHFGAPSTGIGGDRLRRRHDGVSYLSAGPDGRDLPRAIATPGGASSVETARLQGGATTNGPCLSHRLIDTDGLLAHSAIDGLGGVPTMFECPGEAGEKPAAGRSLCHLATKVLGGGMIWPCHGVEAALEVAR